MVKAVDTTGNESINTAIAVVGLGDVIEQNLIQTSDYRALGFPGTIINGAVDGDGTGGGRLLALRLRPCSCYRTG